MFGAKPGGKGVRPVIEEAAPSSGDGYGGGWLSTILSLLKTLVDQQRALSRTVRRQRHAQECFQEQVTGRLAEIFQGERSGSPRPGSSHSSVPVTGLTTAQIEALTGLDQACEHLLHVGHEGEGGAESQPRTSDEAVVMLQVRIRNLQHSFGIEAILSRGRRFDDRIHRVHSVCERRDLADGVVAEEILPGYTLNGQVIRPAVVVVNRLMPSQAPTRKEEREI